MLVNIEHSEDIDPVFEIVFDDMSVQNPKPGYYISHLNFNHQVMTPVIDEYPFHPSLNGTNNSSFEDPRPSYGVCDYPDQVIEKFPTIVRSDKKFFITFTEIKKDEQPESGGWRWHKWGKYIGEKNPTTEYLYDEPEIEKVFVFHVYEVDESYESDESIKSLTRVLNYSTV